MKSSDGAPAACDPRCDYCGLLGWTVEKYGRVTHRESCPHRADLWHQGNPYADTVEYRTTGDFHG